MRWTLLAFALVVCATAGCRGSSEAGDDAADAGQMRPLSRSGPHAGLVGTGSFAGRWESEFFPDLTLTVDGDGRAAGAFANGQGHLEGEVHRDTIDFLFWRGAEDFRDAPVEARGLGSGRLDATGDAAKGTYATDMFEEGRWDMLRAAADDGAPLDRTEG